MPSSITKPDEYTSEQVVSTSDAAGKVVLDFTFDAGQIVLVNDKATSVYASLNSTSGSTGSHQVKAGESRTWSGMRVGRMSLASTSTSTGDVVRVGAWSYG